MNRFFHRRGFTLIELLVTIGIIALLIGIALPALSGAKKRAKDAVGLSNMRQTGIAMEHYVARYDGWLPFAIEGTQFNLSPAPVVGSVSGSHWELKTYWSSLFFEVAPWDEWFGVWTYADPRRSEENPWAGSPGFDGPFYAGRTSLEYSRALFARPEIWEAGDPIVDRDSVLKGVRMSEVRYPSGKVTLFDTELCIRVRCDYPSDVKRAMLFVDGHAGMHSYKDANAPARARLEELRTLHEPIHDTAGGARGRDY